MELDPTLHTKSIGVQLQKLIVDAFECLSPLPRRSYLVIIDGLDECHDKQYRPSSWTTRYRVVLSCALLNWMTMEGRIPFSFFYLYYNPRVIRSLLYQPGYLPYPNCRIFTADTLCVSSVLCSLFRKDLSNVIMLDLTHFLVPSKRTWALSITSPMLFQLKIFLIYSNHFIQDPLYPITLKNLCLICWRLLLSSLRSVLKNATDSLKPLRLTTRFALGAWFRATKRFVRSLLGWTSSPSPWTDRLSESIITKYFTY